MARRIFYCCCCCFTFWAASLCSFHASPAPPEQADSFCILILLLFRFVFVFRVIFLIIMIVMIITLQACLFFLFSFLCFIFDYFNFKAARTRLDTFLSPLALPFVSPSRFWCACACACVYCCLIWGAGQSRVGMPSQVNTRRGFFRAFSLRISLSVCVCVCFVLMKICMRNA